MPAPASRILARLACDLPGLRSRRPRVFWSALVISGVVSCLVAPALALLSGLDTISPRTVAEYDLRVGLGHPLGVPIGFAVCGCLAAAALCLAALGGGLGGHDGRAFWATCGVLLLALNGIIIWLLVVGF